MATHPEITKFGFDSETWLDTEGPLKTLYQINPLRLGFILAFLPTQASGRFSALDLGAGAGIFSLSLARLGIATTAVEANKSAVEAMSQQAQKEGLEIHTHEQQIQDFLKQDTKHYQLVSCLEVLEHLDRPFEVVDAILERVAPQGLVFISSLDKSLKSFCEAIVAGEYILQLLPRGTHDYHKFIPFAKLCMHLEKNGFRVVKTSGIAYNPVSGKFRLKDKPSSNFFVLAQRCP